MAVGKFLMVVIGFADKEKLCEEEAAEFVRGLLMEIKLFNIKVLQRNLSEVEKNLSEMQEERAFEKKREINK